MSQESDPTVRPIRVLVVEDNPISLELVKDVLEADGYAVLTAANGADALELIRAEAPDLVLMDVQLPGIDGLEVTRRVKADPTTRSIPIIALTAHAMRGDDESVEAAGCDGYISKPIRLGAFREVVAAHARLPRAHRGDRTSGAASAHGAPSPPCQPVGRGKEATGTC